MSSLSRTIGTVCEKGPTRTAGPGLVCSISRHVWTVQFWRSKTREKHKWLVTRISLQPVTQRIVEISTLYSIESSQSKSVHGGGTCGRQRVAEMGLISPTCRYGVKLGICDDKRSYLTNSLTGFSPNGVS